MDKSKNYENSIPQDYALVKYVDAKTDRKQIVVYTRLSFRRTVPKTRTCRRMG